MVVRRVLTVGVLPVFLICRANVATATTVAPVLKEAPLDAYHLPSPELFPGQNASATAAAFPARPALGQPAPLAAWPRVGGVPQPCWQAVVLMDFDKGWKGSCTGLTEYPAVHDEATCKQACGQDPLCSVWQFHIATSKCFRGRAARCEDENGVDLAVSSAQRFMHGSINVIRQLTDIEVMSLRFVGNLTASVTNVTNSIQRCKEVCYSDLLCSYWQYGQPTAGATNAGYGCYVEDPGTTSSQQVARVVQYPLTLSGGAIKLLPGQMVGGEYIQHYCPDPPPGGNAGIQSVIDQQDSGHAVTTTQPPSSGGFGWLGWLFFLLLVGGAVAAGFWFWQKKQKSKKTSAKSRGLHQATPEGEAERAMAPPHEAMPPDAQYAAPPQQFEQENYNQNGRHDPSATYYTAWHDMSTPAAGGDFQVQNITRLVHGSRFPGDFQGAHALFSQHTSPEAQGQRPYPVLLIGPHFKEEMYYGDHSGQYVDDFRSWWEAQERAEEPSVQMPSLGSGYMPLPTQEAYQEPVTYQPDVHVPLTKPLLNVQGMGLPDAHAPGSLSHFESASLPAPNLFAQGNTPYTVMPTTSLLQAPGTQLTTFQQPHVQYASSPVTFQAGHAFNTQGQQFAFH